ncbi:formyltransferase family protein [Flavobacterium degerlachei]|jgi:methionyl-tRNA formyltransferase|uniref:Methionyl-tRNA formyltransferase n=1 Tax=Flavobacterium degerlachei TaxID=229203 RepID=A0A1H3GBJ0_9FLAO|nr:formyltransferase family protein [Flavobacterium degerlachei]SDY00712.1 methionyl-tRNA formyltransferase [Flavobacterium degerlachei]
MKIVLFLNKDLQANIAYNLLKEELSNHTVRIYYSESVGNPDGKASDLVQLEYYEKHFFHNEIAGFAKNTKLKSSFEFFDHTFNSFPFEKATNVNSEEFITEMKLYEPDLFISIRFGKIFKDAIIQVPKLGLLNLHSAILPHYKGIMGTLHAIREQNKKIGCTLHTIPDAGIDTGEIIEIAQLDVCQEKSLFWHIIQLYPLGMALLIQSILLLQRGDNLKMKKQNLQEGNYFSVPTENDFQQIKNIGMNIISLNDYEAVLLQFVFGSLTETEKISLRKLLVDSGLTQQ